MLRQMEKPGAAEKLLLASSDIASWSEDTICWFFR
jgi:hypothetical protein